MTCNKCKKQYTVQTTDQFMQEHLYKHFKSERHLDFHGNVSVISIDKTDGFNPSKRETYWMRTLKTIALYGLNVENGV